MKNFKNIIRQALSVLAGQCAVVGYALIDNIIVGHHDTVMYSALSIGVAIYMSIFIGLIGVVQALLPIAGQLYGAKNYPEIGRQFRQCLYLAAWISIIGISILLFPGGILKLAKLSTIQEEMVRSYLLVLALGFIPALCFRIYASLSQAISRPLFVTMLQVGGLAFKLFFNWLFVLQMDMGLSGCALSTTVLNFIFITIATFMMAKHRAFVPLQLIKRMERICWNDQKALLKLGIPIGLCFFIEVTGFAFMNIFVARFGSVSLSAAQQSVSQLASILYMIPFSFGIATGAIVSQYLGSRQFLQARSSGYQGISISIAFSAIAGLFVYLFKEPIVSIFSNDPKVISVAASLIIFISAYQIADAIQTTTAYVLRAYKIALLPTILYAFSLWGIGLFGGYATAFNLTGYTSFSLQGPAGFWLANAISLAFVAIALLILFNYISRQFIQAASQTSAKQIS